MEYINIGDVEKLILAKDKVVTNLIDKKIISENMNFEDFIKYLDISKFIFMKDDSVISFNFIKDINKQSYLFYTGDDIILKQLKSILESLKYDFTKLKKASVEKMLSDDFNKMPKFIIDNKYYLL